MRIILRSITILALGTALFSWIGDAGAQRSTSYEISRSVVSGGGGRSALTSYALTGTFGQPSPIGGSQSEAYNLGSGFWGGMVRAFTVAIESISYSIAEGVWITWHSIADATYTLYYTDALSFSTVWKALPELPGTGGLMEWLDDGTETGTPPTASGILKRFYRLSGQP